MNNDLRRYAPVGLVLSLLAAIAFVGFLLVRGLVNAGIVTLAQPELAQNGVLYSGLSIILGLAIYSILDPEAARKFMLGRQAQYGSNSIIMLLAFAGILIFVNVIVYQNPKSWDLTEDKNNTLAPQTIETLKTLPEPVLANAYYSTRMSTIEARKLLENLQQNANGMFKFQFIDPDQNPIEAQNDNVERDGTIVLRMGDRREPVTFASEQEIVAAMIRLIKPESRVVYFVTGHGEPDIETPSDTSYTLLKATLEKKNYTVKSLSLLAEGKIPADASVVIVAGPQTPLDPKEATLLESYLSGDGSIIYLTEPRPLTKFGESADPLDDMLNRWGITANNDFIIDPNANPAYVAIADPLSYANHPITQKLRGVNSIYPTARSLTIGLIPNETTVTPLVVTNTNAWGETDFTSIDNNQVQFDEGADFPGPVTIVIAAEYTPTNSRLVVFGDSEFAGDALYQRGNGDILVNAIDWAAEQEDLISLTPQELNPRTYTAPGTFGLIAIILTSLCLIPIVVVAGGVGAWMSRRRRG